MSDKIAAVAGGPGAYVVGLPAGKGPLGRLLRPDPHGILDIGESANLRQRLSDLLRCAHGAGERGHMAGWRLGTGRILERMEALPGDLRFSYCTAKDKDEAYRTEGSLLRAYYNLHGELPPLNYKFNWSSWEDDV